MQDIGIFYIYVDIWSILLPFGILYKYLVYLFCGNWYIFLAREETLIACPTVDNMVTKTYQSFTLKSLMTQDPGFWNYVR
jgi:hypothetical protein